MYKTKDKQAQPEESTIYYDKITDADYLGLIQKRREEAEGFWNEKHQLKTVREKNVKEYLSKYVSEQLIDQRYQDVFNDNRQFTSVRTVLPFLTARVTAPEVTPANGTDLAIQFATDFEEILEHHNERQFAKAKIRLAIQDLLKGERVGLIKMRYDKKLNTIVIERVKPSSTVFGKRASQFEELDFFQHTIEKTLAELLRMFTDKRADILTHFGLPTDKDPSYEELAKTYEIKEEWIWIDNGTTCDLVVGWEHDGFTFGKIDDPNWDADGQNVIEHPMIPIVPFNFLNSGDNWIDETSFMEQAHWNQVNYNRRGQVIAENARYGGIGVPIFAKGAIQQKDVAKVKFSPVQRVLLDAPDVTKAFTVWQAGNMPSFINEDKYDSRNNIDNTWATPNVLRGEQTDSNTLGQDYLVRDQAEGRLSDPVDCIDDAMTRFYRLLAQMMFRYFGEDHFYNYKGNDGKFVSLVVNNKEIAKNIGMQINVKAGTSLPIDRAQKRATVLELMKLNKVGTLTAYKELGLFDDPEAAYKEYVVELTDPALSLEEVDKQVFSREAHQDLMMVIGNKVPEEREDIGDEYISWLNEWLLTDKYRILQQKNPDAAARVSGFVDSVIAKAQRKADKMQLQPAPDTGIIPPEVAAVVDGQMQAPPAPVPGEAPQPVPVQ